MPEEITLFGRLDSITPDGLASGWCWSPQQPNLHRSVNLRAGARVVASVLCDQPRPELATIGVGDGRHGFEIRIARSHFPPEPGIAEIHLHDVQTDQVVGAPFAYTYPLAPSLSNLPVRLERIREEGLVNGWCWDPADPARRVTLVVLVDGEPVGLTVADLYREDLKTSGIGDGAHAFMFLLPWEKIADKSIAQISLADRATGQVLPASTIFRRHALKPVEQRLAELERQVRLLNARLDDAARQSRHATARNAGLLAAIGAFFTKLSETAGEDTPTSLVPSLPELLEHNRSQFPALALAAATEPELTAVIAAHFSLETVHACLRAIHLAGLDTIAEIVVLDDGTLTEATLLPALVPNLRYWRVQPGQSVPQARNLIVQQARSRWVGFFSPAVRLTREWWTQAKATFAAQPGCAALGSKLVREDGTIQAAALLPDAHGRLVDLAAGEDAANPAFDMLQPMAACTDIALLVPADLFNALGGFDTGFTDAVAAAIEYGIRLWERGHTLYYQPAIPLRWEDVDGASDLDHRPSDPTMIAWLARRWLTAPRPAWPTPLGHALLIDGPVIEPQPAGPLSDIAGIAGALQQLGWRVSVAIAGGLDLDDPRIMGLRAMGVMVWRAPFQPAITTGIESAGGAFGVIHIAAAAVSALPLERLRTLSPNAKFLLQWNDALPLPPTPTMRAAIDTADTVVLGGQPLATALSGTAHAARLRRLTGRTGLTRFYRNILLEHALPVRPDS